MRYHRAFAELAIVLGTSEGKLIADQLVGARVEPVVRAGFGAAVLDLHFRTEAGRCVVPFVIVDVAMLEARERDPLVWPAAAFASANRFDADGIGDRIEPWLRALAADGSLLRECWHIFGDGEDEVYLRAAQDAGYLGAAPLEVVVRKASPYVFARRHARNRDVYVAARDAELGAVVLAPVARHVELASPDPSAQTWYGPVSDIGERDVAIVDATNRERPEVAGARVVIDVDARDGGVRIEPAPVVPVDSLFDFSGRVQRKESPFSVFIRNDRALRKPVLPDRPAVGGSSGHIVFGLRGRALQHGGADVDLAQVLAGAMQDEGFTVDVVDDPQVAAALRPDLIHAFGLADATAAAQYLRVAKSSDVPFALHPLYDAPALGGYWGATVTPYCFRFMQDEVTVENLCELMRNRRLAVNAIVADSMYHPTQPRWAEDVRTVVGEADALFVAGPQEAAAMREIVRDARTVELPPPVGASVEPAAIAALVGSQSYALMHAPIEATQNQLMAVRAAELAEIPLVIVGPVTDADYAALVRAFAGERVVLLGEPGPALLEGLYRGADLYVDIAWVGCGPARAARAVSRGASLVLSQRTPWEDLGLEEFVRAVNPGDVQAIARGMGDMWTVRQHEEARFEEIRLRAVAGWGVRDVTTAMVAAYAGTLEKRNQPVLR